MTLDGTTTPWLSIIGIGEDGLDGLTPAARSLIESAALVAGGERHIKLAGDLIKGKSLHWTSPLDKAIDEIKSHAGKPVAVLASGDPFHFGIGVTLTRHIPREDMFAIPKPSAFSLVASRLKWPLQDTVTLGLNGRFIEHIVPHLHQSAQIIALTTDGATPAQIADLLIARGCGASRVTVFDKLGGLDEASWSGIASEVGVRTFSPLNTIAIQVDCEEGAKTIPCTPGLPDDWYESDGQLTKREIRSITLSSLAPQPGQRLWDVGCGSGSIAIEWMLSHPRCTAIGIERNPDRASRAARNAISLGVPRLQIVTDEAIDAMTMLPAPDAVMVGGGASDENLVRAAWGHLVAGGRIVANAVTLETETVLRALHTEFGGTLTRISIERAEAVGRFTGWRPAMPVVQWVAQKP